MNLSKSVLSTPVALLVFNRPVETARVFEAIREAQPQQLLVIADGPRSNRSGESKLCEEVRLIVEQVDWPCEVLRNYSENNIGCKLRVSSGLDWVFNQVEEAIILEDDCLPEQSFFRFCQEMLNQYRYEVSVMSICGSNLLERWKDDLQSYHFSHYGGVWGWATWRRAWNFYDVNMPLWRNPESRRHIFEVLGEGSLYKSRITDFEKVAAGHVDTWDYQWSFAQLMQSGLTIISSLNLVSNIGFNADATHTVSTNHALAAIPTFSCQFPLRLNNHISADIDYDSTLSSKILSERPLLQKICDFVQNLKVKIFGQGLLKS
jgi:hypothetical protein